MTGPGGLTGNADPARDPVWSVGWDHRSLILMVLDQGAWHRYRLPKASHSYDGAHGWNTEWPRIRDIGETDLLMTMHDTFWRFPRTFSAAHSAGIAPRSTYLKVIGDFARWNDRLMLGCDDTAQSEFLNKRRAKGNLAGPGHSHSNLWFIDPAQLDRFGAPLGRGAVWVDEPVAHETPSDPFLFSGYDHRGLQLVGDPETVAEKMLWEHQALGGLSRITLLLNGGAIPHRQVMRAIELLGTRVVPLVKKAWTAIPPGQDSGRGRVKWPDTP